MPTSFDHIARQYDATFTDTPIGRMQRKFVHDYLKIHLSAPAHILEINCGTGEDALQLATDGHSVVFTDASAAMVELAMQKTASVRPRATGMVWDMRTPFPGDEQFDIIFSNFGGLNCLTQNELEALCERLHPLLKTGGQLIFIVMGRRCWWEMAYFFSKGKFYSAFRRRKKTGVIARLNETTEVNTFYYAPQEIKKIFHNHFTEIHLQPIGFFIPPSYLQPFFSKHPRWLQQLNKWEGYAAKKRWLSNRADHYVITLRVN